MRRRLIRMKKAAIIIPIYNGSRYLPRTIRSVFRQSYGNIELITIDDGSTDDSYEVLRRLQEEAPETVRMRIFRQENAGICATRNRAMDLAESDFIFFLDQDDLLKRNYVRHMVGELEEKDADLLIGGYELLNEADKVLDRWTLDPDLPWCKFRISAPWGRVFRKRIIDENRIRFMITRISEDFYFNLVYMSCCSKICVSDYSGYGWRYREDSESHANMSRLSPDRNPLPMMTRVLEDMRQDNILEPELLEYMMIKHIVWYLLFTVRGASAEDIRKIYRECFDWLAKNYPGYYQNRQLCPGKPEGETFRVQTIVSGAVRAHRAGLFYPALLLYSKL